jgi:hypothetical protein
MSRRTDRNVEAIDNAGRLRLRVRTETCFSDNSVNQSGLDEVLRSMMTGHVPVSITRLC